MPELLIPLGVGSNTSVGEPTEVQIQAGVAFVCMDHELSSDCANLHVLPMHQCCHEHVGKRQLHATMVCNSAAAIVFKAALILF